MDMEMSNNDERKSLYGCRGYVHIVEDGDTLYKISKQYDVKLFDIMRLNPYINVYNLQIGDEICIPTMPMKPEKTYVVNEGDTISNLINAFQLPLDTIVKYNKNLLDVELPEGLIVKVPIRMPRNVEGFEEEVSE